MMKTILILAVCFAVAAPFIYCASSGPESAKSIKLLAPQTEGGIPLMQALKERKSERDFSSTELPLDEIKTRSESNSCANSRVSKKINTQICQNVVYT